MRNHLLKQPWLRCYLEANGGFFLLGGRHDAGLPHGGRLKDCHASVAVGSGSGYRLHARLAVNLQFAVPGLHVGDQGLLLL